MRSTDSKRSHRILVIDDNTAIHEDFCKILLKTNANDKDLQDLESALFGLEAQRVASRTFRIDCVTQGKEGLEMVGQAQSANDPYALAFVDGRMPPGWDGIETIGRLWQEAPDLQVVLCTAYADYSWHEIRNKLGESDSLLILKKPFDNVEVLQLAHALTRKWEMNREIQGRLNQLAFYDNLTGLPNRTLFMERLSQTLDTARRHGHKNALLFIDMDNFKRINDTLGHTIGDELLRTTAERLTRCLRSSDLVSRSINQGIAARLGGDEFVVVLTELDKDEDAALVAQRIGKHLAQPMNLGSHQVIITPSIGIALFPQDGENVETLLKNADLAMYFAKRVGPNTFKYYQESMNAAALKRLTIENQLRRAIERDEFTLNYQPQFELASEKLCGMEALLRWNNPELGEVPPVEFIPIAEESGLIIPIGEWVLRTACSQATAWIRQGLAVHRMAVNVSVKQFMQPNFIEIIRNILTETALEPRRLEIEITESLLAKDSESVAAVLQALNDMQVRIAVDDFGTGYSSLGRLKELPIDCLKIDRSFICGIDGGARDQSIICAIIAMAKGMNLTVIAEGVETDGQVDFLRDKHCRQAQGYLFSRPLSTSRAEALLRKTLSTTESAGNSGK
jgi:diguanylate cyclase (GGDEF)-like protein